MRTWKLANPNTPDGLLDDTRNFLNSKNKLKACLVSIPTVMDVKTAIDNIGGIISADTMSLEIWWDSTKQTLDIILISSVSDLDKFKQAIYNMYQNVDFEDADDLNPEWFDSEKEYQIFDVGYKHGHFSTVFDLSKTHQLITQVSNTIPLTKYAWIQLVFRNHSFVKELQTHSTNLKNNYNLITNDEYFSTSDLLFSNKTTGGEHPEKYDDFATNYKLLENHTTAKTQSSPVEL